jgi:hypothetical protein
LAEVAAEQRHQIDTSPKQADLEQLEGDAREL